MSAVQSIPQLPDLEQDEFVSSQLLLGGLPLPVIIRPARPLSDEELLAFCAANDALQIESDADGSITLMTPAFAGTSWLNQLFSTELTLWARQDGRGVVFGPDLGVRFPDKVMRCPDAAWLSMERWNAARARKRKPVGFLKSCPEFIAEIRSETDRASQLEAKMELWMERGAELGWLIDPKRKLAMIYRPEQEPVTMLRPDFLEGEGPIQGFRLEMREFWQ
jgi:Uma2 family endonuclease